MSETLPLHQLATLVAVLDSGGFDAAARVLHVSAPAVSQRLRALETQVGRSLVHRTVPPTPTAAGERLLPHARRLVALAQDAASAVGLGGGEGERPRLHVAVNADSLDTWFLDAVASAPIAHGAQIILERADQEHTERLLVDGRSQAAVTSASEAAPGCTSVLLGIMRYLPLAAPALLARHGVLGSDGRAIGVDLATLPVVEFDEQDTLQADVTRQWLGHEATPPAHRVPSSTAFARAVEAGLGWGMLPEQQAASALARGTLVPLGAGQARDVVLYWQAWDTPTAALAALGAHLVGRAKAVLRQPAGSVQGKASPAGA